jgi:tetratricopeptide (TPR) repeat protein
VKVDRAARLLPLLEATLPLRRLLYSAAEPLEGGPAGPQPDLTVSGRTLLAPTLRAHLPGAFAGWHAHVAALADHCLAALEAQDGGRPAEAAAALLAAGRREQAAGRHREATVWVRAALDLAQGLTDRRTEVEARLLWGALALALGDVAAAVGQYETALLLAEAGFDLEGGIAAAEGLAACWAARGDESLAQVWLTRALAAAAGEKRAAVEGRLHRALAASALRRGDLAVARQEISRARALLETEGDAFEMARTLEVEGRLALVLDTESAAQAALRESLAWIRRAGGDPVLELEVRCALADVALARGLPRGAEEELRRAEQVALDHGPWSPLIDIYTRLGGVRCRAPGEETDHACQFFEEALALCRTFAAPPPARGRCLPALRGPAGARRPPRGGQGAPPPRVRPPRHLRSRPSERRRERGAPRPRALNRWNRAGAPP